MINRYGPSVTRVAGEAGTWETRIRYGSGRRKRFIIRHCRTEDAAIERAKSMTELADKLVAAGKVGDVEAILEAAAVAESMAKFLVVRNLAHRVCSGAYDGAARSRARLPEDITFREFASLWVDGELNRRWPDHVELKKTASDDAWRLGNHILPILGDLAVRDVTLDEVDDVMSGLPRKLSKASRRHVAQIMVKLLHMACYPARLRTVSPIPRGWLPRLGPKLSYPILTSKEDAALLRETAIPLVRRLLYGFLHREGVRRGDAEGLRWRQLDLDLGTLRVEIDKTKHSRLFSLNPGVAAALLHWKQLKGDVEPDDLVMTDFSGGLPATDTLLTNFGVTWRAPASSDGNCSCHTVVGVALLCTGCGTRSSRAASRSGCRRIWSGSILATAQESCSAIVSLLNQSLI